MGLCVTRAVLECLRAEAARAAPHECCGLLLGSGELIEEVRTAANVAIDGDRRFEVEPQALVDAHRAARHGGPEVIGYYHSHPGGPAEPSAADRAEAAHDRAVWAIIGEGGVAFWRDEETGFVPLSYTIADR